MFIKTSKNGVIAHVLGYDLFKVTFIFIILFLYILIFIVGIDYVGFL